MVRMTQGCLAIAVCGLLSVTAAYGEDYYGEVMTVAGTAYVVSEDAGQRLLNPGDLVKVGDRIEVAETSHVDIAFDKEWNNIARVGEKSTADIRSVYPTGIGLSEGDIFAKLHNLPKGTTFEVQTPIAVAAVRGSEYWTEHRDGATRVLNFSPSPVEVFALSDKGDLIGRTIVQQTEKTEIRMMNEAPDPPQRMDADEIIRATEHSAGIDLSVETVIDEGRVGKSQDVDAVTERLKVQAEEKRFGDREPGEEKPLVGRDSDDSKEVAKGDSPKDENPKEDAPKDRGVKDSEPKVKTEEPKVKVEEPKVKVEEPKIKVEEPKIKIEEPKVKVTEPTIRIEEPRVRVEKIEDRSDRDHDRKGSRKDKD